MRFTKYSISTKLSACPCPRQYTQTERTIDFRLAYAPAHPTLDAFVRTVAADLQLPGVVSAANGSELERILLADNYVAGIQFGGAEVTL